jgi:hypothetical protein
VSEREREKSFPSLSFVCRFSFAACCHILLCLFDIIIFIHWKHISFLYIYLIFMLLQKYNIIVCSMDNLMVRESVSVQLGNLFLLIFMFWPNDLCYKLWIFFPFLFSFSSFFFSFFVRSRDDCSHIKILLHMVDNSLMRD